MRGKTKLSLAGLSIGLLLVAGLLYWSITENTPSVAPKGSAETSPAPQASAPATISPSAPPATAQSEQATPPPASTATAPSAPPATAQSDQATPPPASTATPPVIPMPAETGMFEAQRRQVQEALSRLGYYQGDVDGIFGRLTRDAIRRFQKDIGAEATGRLTAEEATRLMRTH